MATPDSGWLTLLQKIDWWVSAAICTAAAIVLGLVALKAPWFGQLPGTSAAIVGVVGVLFFCLMIFQTIARVVENRSDKVRRPVKKLSARQREFLLRVVRTGSRDFKVYGRESSQRWLEELQNWNYIKWNSPLIYTADSPDYYSITEDGWKQLEKYQKRDG